MTGEDSRDVSGLLVAWNNGDEVALDRLMSFLYPELRRIARRHLRGRGAGETLESAALANEAYLKLTRAGGIRCENRVH
ncbi:MAG TPA: ECF-type sigma factor, partial [Thermoanaerobaculia bacterium]